MIGDRGYLWLYGAVQKEVKRAENETAFVRSATTPGIGVGLGLEKEEEVKVTKVLLVTVHSNLSISPTPYTSSLPESVDTSDGVGDEARGDLADLVVFDDTTDAVDGIRGMAAAAVFRRAIRSVGMVVGHSCNFLQPPLHRVGLRMKSKQTRGNSFLALGGMILPRGFFTADLPMSILRSLICCDIVVTSVFVRLTSAIVKKAVVSFPCNTSCSASSENSSACGATGPYKAV